MYCCEDVAFLLGHFHPARSRGSIRPHAAPLYWARVYSTTIAEPSSFDAITLPHRGAPRDSDLDPQHDRTSHSLYEVRTRIMSTEVPTMIVIQDKIIYMPLTLPLYGTRSSTSR